MIAILFKFFGLLPGQSRTAFLAEVKELSDDEKRELVAMIEALA